MKSSTCINCRGRNGKNKQLYPTYKIVKQRADSIFQKKGIELGFYQCPISQGWHLTKNLYSF